MSILNPNSAAAFLQRGGSGENMQRLSVDTDITAYSGGGRSFDSVFAGGEYVGTMRTGNAGRYTLDVSSRRATISAIRDLAEEDCLFNLFVAEGDCPVGAIGDFKSATLFIDCGVTSEATTQPLMSGSTPAGSDPRDTVSVSAAKRIEFRQLNWQQGAAEASGPVSIHDVIYIPRKGCASCTNGGVAIAVGVIQNADEEDRPYIAINYPDQDNVWTRYPLADEEDSIHSVTESQGVVTFAFNNAKLKYTNLNDFGATWGTPVIGGIPNPSEIWRAVEALGGGMVLAVSSVGTYISYDNGRSYKLLFSGLSITFPMPNQIKFIDKNTIFIKTSTELIRIKNLTSFERHAPPLFENFLSIGVSKHRRELYYGTDAGKIYRVRNADRPAIPNLLQAAEEYPNDVNRPFGDIEFAGTNDTLMVAIASTNSQGIVLDYSGGAGIAFATSINPASLPLLPVNPCIAVVDQNKIIVGGGYYATPPQIGTLIG